MLRRILRPRVLVYLALLLAGIVLYAGTLAMRTPLKLDVILDRGTMGSRPEPGAIENVYRLQVMNTDERPHRYALAVSGMDGLSILPHEDIALGATESRVVAVRVRFQGEHAGSGSHGIVFALTAQDDADMRVAERAAFYVPR